MLLCLRAVEQHRAADFGDPAFERGVGLGHAGGGGSLWRPSFPGADEVTFASGFSPGRRKVG
jgi:hypothetical protein